jgi:hypothetical protein
MLIDPHGLTALWLLVGPVGPQENRSPPGDLLGEAVDGLEDQNADGIGEILVSAPSSYESAGSVWVVSGATGEPLTRVVGEAPGDWLGSHACGLGDIDGDGREDFAAGWSGSRPGLGGVAVVSGDGSRLLTIRGEARTVLGRGFCGMDDFNGDGRRDLALLAMDFEVHTKANRRERSVPTVLVVSGIDGRELARVSDVLGLAREHTALAPAGDVNGDGRSDILLSGAREGSARAFVEVRSGRDLAVIHRIEGPRHECDFGSSIAAAGDIDGDGFGDVIAGYPRRLYMDTRDDKAPLSARVYSGLSGRLLFEFLFECSGLDGYAQALSTAGDVDGDGRDDFLIGSSTLGPYVELRSGRTGQVFRKWTRSDGRIENYHFGETVASVPDLDGDCAPDVAVGAVNFHAPSLPGRVELLSSRTGALLREIKFDSLQTAWASEGRILSGERSR